MRGDLYDSLSESSAWIKLDHLLNSINMANNPQKPVNRTQTPSADPDMVSRNGSLKNQRTQTPASSKRPTIDTKQPDATNQPSRKTDPSGSRLFDEEE